MKINIIYFSQTGNTRKVAKTMTEVFNSENHTARTISFKNATQADFIDSDLIGVGAPCFESQAPSIITDYLNSLPDMDNKKVFVFSTSGGAPGEGTL